MEHKKLSKKQLKINREYADRRYKELSAVKLQCKFCDTDATLHSINGHLKSKYCIKYRGFLYTDILQQERELQKFMFIIQIIKDKKADLTISNSSLINKDEYDKIKVMIPETPEDT